ncbi:unnamed protein product [Timema podura]|uniref:Uncharacterized protein n=1 Tax=Timema podura TaxID=61482 RepID=A0ABN7PBJ0_TIMPD|nr:unnamed protein product [Timema podura]
MASARKRAIPTECPPHVGEDSANSCGYRVPCGKLQCWIDFPEPWQWQVYMTSVAVALFIIPAVIISACYTVIVVTIWSKSKVLTPTGRPRVSNRSE